ncbi:MAG: ATP-binding protein [Candidatus Omnitrophica bacterium]|nr:ATP-binding protein [Candidatus Omnitrophota bacterium]
MYKPESLCSVSHGCPCGFLTDPKKECHCTPPKIQKYLSKISRTIADLEGKEKIEASHVSEAIQYRSLDRSAWM